MIRRLCVIGVGLIGGSLALALRRAGYCGQIVGAGRNAAHLARAVELGVIDGYDLDLGQAVTGADMVVLAVPMGAMANVLATIGDHLAPEAVLTDVGSAKAAVIAAAHEALGVLPPGFVPGHPIAGTEHSGVDAAFPELFQGRRVVLTPTPASSAQAVAAVRAMWETAGAAVEDMDAATHDRVLAATSHLPHVVAFALVHSLSRVDTETDILRYAAGGFRDFTRIAGSDPVMWRDICLTNAPAILESLDRFRADLDELVRAIAAGDGPRIETVFREAKRTRDAFRS
ncbi:MAG TPA: prephenate dehydrogenase/arogenate dehydrogenase family protein [Candidatus Macondimonas sp.]|nr:prephenate dehydrogenase/arogenate dehydrogenase family protein [Candidatus Macondimonas sp.]